MLLLTLLVGEVCLLNRLNFPYGLPELWIMLMLSNVSIFFAPNIREVRRFHHNKSRHYMISSPCLLKVLPASRRLIIHNRPIELLSTWVVCEIAQMDHLGFVGGIGNM